MRRSGPAAAIAAMVTLLINTATAAPADKIFIVGNYPVEARAGDAVAAKTKAIADGQKAALRSLLKRLVPVTAYARIKTLVTADAARMVDSLSVRSERNSTTEYIATLDFQFSATAVRQLLEREGIPFADAQAPAIALVPIWRAPPDTPDMPAEFGPTQGPKTWTDAWKSLDLEHTLTPIKLDVIKAEIHADTLKALALGDAAMWRTFAQSYQSERLVAAIAEPDLAAKKLNVTLIGVDAAGGLAWRRGYRVDLSDPNYAIELAGVVSLGVLEGRWKAQTVRGGTSVAAAGPGLTTPSSKPAADGSLAVNVEFRNMAEWQDISRRLSAIPGVEDLDVLGMSGRNARITLRYPGGAARLADALSEHGLGLRQAPTGWILAAK
jgi:Uncharacterized protein conserved in bacteria (DUF2066)